MAQKSTDLAEADESPMTLSKPPAAKSLAEFHGALNKPEAVYVFSFRDLYAAGPFLPNDLEMTPAAIRILCAGHISIFAPNAKTISSRSKAETLCGSRRRADSRSEKTSLKLQPAKIADWGRFPRTARKEKELADKLINFFSLPISVRMAFNRRPIARRLRSQFAKRVPLPVSIANTAIARHKSSGIHRTSE